MNDMHADKQNPVFGLIIKYIPHNNKLLINPLYPTNTLKKVYLTPPLPSPLPSSMPHFTQKAPQLILNNTTQHYITTVEVTSHTPRSIYTCTHAE
jgi:hypothetical protein